MSLSIDVVVPTYNGWDLTESCLRHLARQEPKLYGGLYAVLLETMARDGEKHAYMLRYLLRRLEAQAS